MITESEKHYWINFLRSIGDGSIFNGSVFRCLDLEKLRLISELADDLELEWFPKRRRGRRLKSEWTFYKRMEHNIAAKQYRSQVATEVDRIKKRGERPYGGARDAAIAKIAQRHGIEPDTLKKRMRLIQYRHPEPVYYP